MPRAYDRGCTLAAARIEQSPKVGRRANSLHDVIAIEVLNGISETLLLRGAPPHSARSTVRMRRNKPSGPLRIAIDAEPVDHRKDLVRARTAEVMQATTWAVTQPFDKRIRADFHGWDDDASVASRSAPTRLMSIHDGNIDPTIGESDRG
jgi:hypothetical protein